jgi:hypothetical protein
MIAENQHIEGVFEVSQNIIESINKNLISKYIQNEIRFLELLGFGVPTDIKQNFILNMKKSSDSFLEFTDENSINETMEQIVSFIELLEEKQKLSDKIKVKNVKTSGNTTKKIMNKDYENMKNNNSEKSAETENTITTEADDKDTKHSNVIHINFKGDKD